VKESSTFPALLRGRARVYILSCVRAGWIGSGLMNMGPLEEVRIESPCVNFDW